MGTSALGEVTPATLNYRESVRPSIRTMMWSPDAYAVDLRNRQEDAKSGRAGTEGAEGGAGAADEGEVTKLTTFQGVTVPVLLNIFGVILFLRLGWVAGQAGTLYGTLIICLSNVVTGITALSLCAICTNGEVKGGGAYFLISRALGPAFGGAIGLLFYIAQAVATSLYVIGFAESVLDVVKKGGGSPLTDSWLNDTRLISVVVMIFLLALALIGVGWYAKCQVVLLITLVAAIASVAIGTLFPSVPDRTENAEAGFVGYSRDIPAATANVTAPQDSWVLPQWSADPVTQSSHDFFTVFSVFFPAGASRALRVRAGGGGLPTSRGAGAAAVTGIMAGANLSGDLKDPSRSIPNGTLTAIAITWVTYVVLLWLVGAVSVRCVAAEGVCPPSATLEWAKAVAESDVPSGGLLYDKLIMQSISIFGWLVLAGVFAATLSSALASLVGAPRILQVWPPRAHACTHTRLTRLTRDPLGSRWLATTCSRGARCPSSAPAAALPMSPCARTCSRSSSPCCAACWASWT